MSKTKTAHNSISSFLVTEEQELLKKLENLQSKRSLEVLSTFLPDHILKSPKCVNKYETHFVVLLFIEISGITSLCEKYNKVGNGGINLLTACLNTYIGSMIEIIHFYGGDVLNFTGDEIMAYWRSLQERSRTIHQVIVCAMYIQEVLGEYETEVNIVLKMKISVCYGDACFFVIGEDLDKELVVNGSVTEDVKFVKPISSSGDVVLSAATWRCLPVHHYRVTPLAQGFVKLLNFEYSSENEEQLREDEEKRNLLDQLCAKHFQHRNDVFRKKHFTDTVTQSDIYQQFVRSLPQRISINMAVKHWQTYDLRPFVMRLIQNQLDNRSSVENLTESREVTVQYINFLTTYKCNFIDLLDGIYNKVHDIISQFLGILVSVSILDKDVTMLVAYGTKPCRQELESKNALVSAYKIKEAVSDTRDIKSVSIGIANGCVYSGVIGHPMRKEFILVGKVVTTAAKFMCCFPGKVTCDYKTYKNSKLATQYFNLLPASGMKTEESAIFEYKGLLDIPIVGNGTVLVGRDDESDLVMTIVNHPDKVNYYGICFHGQHKVGKSRLLQANFSDLYRGGYTIASVELSQCTQRPYFCISTLYKQLYNLKSTIDSDEFVLVKELPTDLWDFSEILQTTLHCRDSYLPVQRKFRILSLFREITRTCELGFAVIIIDNIQYVDQHSFDILEAIIGEGVIRLICAGQFEEEFWDVRFRMSLNNHIKLFELGCLRKESVPRLVCGLLEVTGVSLKLIDEIVNSCDLNPGLIEIILMRLVLENTVKMSYVADISRMTSKYYFRNECLDKPNAVIATLREDFQLTSKIRIADLSSEIINKMPLFDLDLLKTCSGLGDIFTRLLLKTLFKYSSEFNFANAVKSFFEMGIFDCGSKYLKPEGLSFDEPSCYCNLNENEIRQDRMMLGLPKYALCELLHFKNRNIKNAAYDLVDEEAKRNLHMKVTEILENLNHSCRNCFQNNSAPIVVIPKFREVSYLCSAVVNCKCESYAREVKEIRQKSCASGESVWDTQNFIGVKRKVWDSSICSCLDILTQAYTDLMYHSRKTNHTEKTIYFTMQKGFIMMLMNEFEEAISILNAANDMCHEDGQLEESFRDIHVAKINLLVSQAYLSLNDAQMARRHLLVSLKEYEITVDSFQPGTKYFQASKIEYEDFKLKLRNSIIQNDFGTCLNLVSSLFAHEGNWEMAKVASNQCVNFLNDHLASVSVLCDIYSNAIRVYSYVGEQKTCDRLEKSVSQHILKRFNNNVIYDLFSISKLIYTIFHTRFVSGHIDTAIRLGYRALDMNNSIHACRIQVDVVSILSTALLYAKRIEDSVETARTLYGIGRGTDEFALLAYFAYCMELILDTSFYLEPVENVITFAQTYFNMPLSNKFSTIEETLLLNVYAFAVRTNRWGDIHRWKAPVQNVKFSCDSAQSMKNLLRHTETLMINYVRSEAVRRHEAEDERKNLKNYLKQCKSVSKKWRLFRSRYLHLKAYYCRLVDKRAQMKKYLREAEHIAIRHGNVLERCWLMQSGNVWNGGFSFEGDDRKYIEWKMAKTYTHLHWSQIMYGLPWHL